MSILILSKYSCIMFYKIFDNHAYNYILNWVVLLHVDIYIHICVCVYMCVFIYVYVCVCVHVGSDYLLYTNNLTFIKVFFTCNVETR